MVFLWQSFSGSEAISIPAVRLSMMPQHQLGLAQALVVDNHYPYTTDRKNNRDS